MDLIEVPRAYLHWPPSTDLPIALLVDHGRLGDCPLPVRRSGVDVVELAVTVERRWPDVEHP